MTDEDALRPFIPSSQFDAGRVHIAANPPLSWYDVVDSLDPNFSVSSADQLKADVLPITSQDRLIQEQARAFGLGFNFAQRSVQKTDSTTTELLSEGQTEPTTSNETTRVETLSPGSVPDQGALELSELLGGQSGVPEAASELGMDPFLRVRLQTALFQEIQLLNSYLRADLAGAGYEPYLFRTQISVQPFARRMPFDLYTEIFFPDVNEWANSSTSEERGTNTGVIVLPLIITDNLERSAEQKLARAVRQLRFTTSALVNNNGLGASVGDLDRAIRETEAFDLNASFLVGQSRGDELTVRIGANKGANGSYAMTARNYDVTYLVLWPSGRDWGRAIRWSTSMRSVHDGKKLPVFSAESLDNAISEIEALYLSQYLRAGAIQETCAALLRFNLKSNQIAEYARKEEQELTEDEKNCLYTSGSRKVSSSVNDRYVMGFLRRYGMEHDAEAYQLVRDFFEAKWVGERAFNLPTRRYELPQIQTAVVSDNGATKATVPLLGARGLTKVDILSAHLLLEADGGQHCASLGLLDSSSSDFFQQALAPQDGSRIALAARRVLLTSPRTVELEFPSPSALGFSNRIKAGNACVVLIRRPSIPATGGTVREGYAAFPASGENNGQAEIGVYPVIANLKTLPKPDRLFDLRLLPSTSPIRTDSTAEVALVITEKPCPSTVSCPTIDGYRLVVGDFKVKSVAAAGASALTPTALNVYTLRKNTTYTLIIDNATADGEATVTVSALSGESLVDATTQSVSTKLKFKSN